MSNTPDGTLARYREAAIEAVEERGLRRVAAEMEMNPPTLWNFVHRTGTVRTGTLKKLRSWMARREAGPVLAEVDPPLLAQIRAAVMVALKNTALRPLAREIGLGTTTFYNFVHEQGKCSRRTYNTLLAWYELRASELRLEDYKRSVWLLFFSGDLPRPAAKRLLRDLVVGFEREYAAVGKPAPHWIAGIQKDLQRTRL